MCVAQKGISLVAVLLLVHLLPIVYLLDLFDLAGRLSPYIVVALVAGIYRLL